MSHEVMPGDSSNQADRRRALRAITLFAASAWAFPGVGCSALGKDGRPRPPFGREPIAAAAEAAALDKQHWGAEDLNAFLAALPANDLHQLALGLELVKADSKPPATAAELSALELAIKRKLLSISSSFFTKPFKDENRIDYDKIVRWVGKKYDIEASSLSSDSTFSVEQRIVLKIFAGIWDKLSPEQRAKLLDDVDPSGSKVAGRAALVVASGSAAAAVLSTTALLSGFAFYTTMSAVISSSAALLGVTLPFAAYSGASATVGVLTGPIGWSLMAVGGLAALVWYAGADAQKSAAIVAQINTLRARAWQAAGRQIPSVHR